MFETFLPVYVLMASGHPGTPRGLTRAPATAPRSPSALRRGEKTGAVSRSRHSRQQGGYGLHLGRGWRISGTYSSHL